MMQEALFHFKSWIRDQEVERLEIFIIKVVHLNKFGLKV